VQAKQKFLFSLVIWCFGIGLLPLPVQGQQAPSPATSPTPLTSTAAGKPSAAPIKIGDLTVSGSVRLRFENWDWFDAAPADDKYNEANITLRVAVGQSNERFDWQVEGEVPVLIGVPSRAVAPAPQGPLGMGGNYYATNGRQDASGVFKQGFVRFKGVFGHASSSLKLGRFEFQDGTEMMSANATLATLKQDRLSQKFIGTYSFTPVGRSFDGLLFARQTKASNFTFLAVRPTAGGIDLHGNKELEIDVSYGAFTKPLRFKSGESEYRLFALHYHDGRRVLKVDNRTLALRNADFAKIRMTEVGGHYIGVYKVRGGKADVLLWGAGQFGSWGNLVHRAGAIALEAGFQPNGRIAAKFNTWLRGGYLRSTGDGDPTDKTHGTFFQGLPTPRVYARLPFYNLMNSADAFVEILMKPHPKLAWRADYHHVQLSNSRDLWYVGSGAFQNQTFGFTGRPSSGKKTLGDYVDTSLDYALNPRTVLGFYVGVVRGGAVVSGLHPLGANGRFAFIQVTQRF